MLELDASEQSNEILQELIYEEDINSKAFLEYFAPLYSFLKEENDKVRIVQLLKEHSEAASLHCNDIQTAKWNLATDVLNNVPLYEELRIKLKKNAEFIKNQKEKFSKFNSEQFEDIVQRQLGVIQNIGVNILPEDEFDELMVVNRQIELIFSSTRICPYDKQNCDKDKEGLQLEPGEFRSIFIFTMFWQNNFYQKTLQSCMLRYPRKW